jgi:hypothetical protein
VYRMEDLKEFGRGIGAHAGYWNSGTKAMEPVHNITLKCVGTTQHFLRVNCRDSRAITAAITF